MKRIFLYTLLFCAIGSCSENEFEYHQTYFTPQEPNGKVLYADQTNDSTLLVSYDPWKATLEFTDEHKWFTITPMECQFGSGTEYTETKMYINATPNTSGKIRNGHIHINTYDIKSTYLVGMSVSQLPWLNITKPHGIWNEEEGVERFFVNIDTPTSGSFEVIFTVYGEDAALTSNAAWLTPQSGVISAGKQQVVTINVDENRDTSAPRTAVLTLKSKGIATPITVTQAKANY